MFLEIGPHLRVGVDQRGDDVGPDPVAHPGGRTGDQPLDVQLVRIEEKSHHRHLVVRLVGDVGEHQDAVFLDVGIDAGGERIGRTGCLLRAGMR